MVGCRIAVECAGAASGCESTVGNVDRDCCGRRDRVDLVRDLVSLGAVVGWKDCARNSKRTILDSRVSRSTPGDGAWMDLGVAVV